VSTQPLQCAIENGVIVNHRFQSLTDVISPLDRQLPESAQLFDRSHHDADEDGVFGSHSQSAEDDPDTVPGDGGSAHTVSHPYSGSGSHSTAPAENTHPSGHSSVLRDTPSHDATEESRQICPENPSSARSVDNDAALRAFGGINPLQN